MYNSILEFIKETKCLGARDDIGVDEKSQSSRFESEVRKISKKKKSREDNNSKSRSPREYDSPRNTKSPKKRKTSTPKRKNESPATSRKISQEKEKSNGSGSPKKKATSNFKTSKNKSREEISNFENSFGDDSKFEIKDIPKIKVVKFAIEENEIETPKLKSLISEMDTPMKSSGNMQPLSLLAHSKDSIMLNLHDPTENNKIFKFPESQSQDEIFDSKRELRINYDNEDTASKSKNSGNEFKISFDQSFSFEDDYINESMTFVNELTNLKMQDLDFVNKLINDGSNSKEYIKFVFTASWSTSLLTKITRKFILTDQSVSIIKNNKSLRKKIFYSEIYKVYLDFSNTMLLIAPLSGKKITFFSDKSQTLFLFLKNTYKEELKKPLPCSFLSSKEILKRKKTKNLNLYEKSQTNQIKNSLMKKLPKANYIDYREILISHANHIYQGLFILTDLGLAFMRNSKFHTFLPFNFINRVMIDKLSTALLISTPGDKVLILTKQAPILAKIVKEILNKHFDVVLDLDIVEDVNDLKRLCIL